MEAEAEIDIKPNRRHRATENVTPELFWKRVMKPVGCWLYTGAKESNGYGYLQNPFAEKPKFLTAHRVAWIYANGPIPEGMLVLHRCDVRSCINPEHLFLGTHAQNAADKVTKARQMSGEDAWCAKLTEADVIALRRRARAGEVYSKMAAEFGVTTTTVTCAVSGRTWKNVTEPAYRKHP